MGWKWGTYEYPTKLVDEQSSKEPPWTLKRLTKPSWPMGGHPKPIPPISPNIQLYITHVTCSDDEDRVSVSDKVLVCFGAVFGVQLCFACFEGLEARPTDTPTDTYRYPVCKVLGSGQTTPKTLGQCSLLPHLLFIFAPVHLVLDRMMHLQPRRENATKAPHEAQPHAPARITTSQHARASPRSYAPA